MATLYRLSKESLHPPDAGNVPWILIENQAHVADRRNSTTAFSDCSCDGQVQVTLFVDTPPRVSYLCVFARRRGPRPSNDDEEEEGQMITVESEIIATDKDLVLLRITVSDRKELHLNDAFDFFVYQPAGDGGPLLTRLGRPNAYCADSFISGYHPYGFDGYQVGLVTCTASRRDDHTHYMVAALSQDIYDRPALARGRFILHLYNSRLQTWTANNVSLSDQQHQKYQNEQGYFIHINTKVIAVGGEDATIAFVDLWRGILLCDLSRVQDRPWLHYVPLPYRREEMMILSDARLSRDIAVVKGHFKYVLRSRLYADGWVSAMFTMPVSSCSLLDDNWKLACEIESDKMDTEDSLNFHLLPKLDDLDGRPFSHLIDLHVSQPTLSLDTDHTVCFMAKIESDDDKAWVITVDMKNNRLTEVAEFDASRYYMLGIAFRHSKISKYLKMAQGTKENLKRQGILLQGSCEKKLACPTEMAGMAEGRGDGGAMLMG